MNKIYYVYRHIRPDNNEPFYIGIGHRIVGKEYTTFENEYSRAHSFGEKHRKKFWRNIYNKNNQEIEVEIIFESSCINEIKEKEKEFIKLYGRSDLGLGTLCNLTDGGDGFEGLVHTEEFRTTLADRNRNRVYTEEDRLKASQSRKGIPTYRRPSQETINRISALHKGKTIPEEYRRKISNSLKGRFVWGKNPFAVAIVQLSLNGDFIREWGSVAEALRELKINNVSAVLNGVQKKAGGFRWVYKKDYYKKP